MLTWAGFALVCDGLDTCEAACRSGELQACLDEVRLAETTQPNLIAAERLVSPSCRQNDVAACAVLAPLVRDRFRDLFPANEVLADACVAGDGEACGAWYILWHPPNILYSTPPARTADVRDALAARCEDGVGLACLLAADLSLWTGRTSEVLGRLEQGCRVDRSICSHLVEALVSGRIDTVGLRLDRAGLAPVGAERSRGRRVDERELIDSLRADALAVALDQRDIAACSADLSSLDCAKGVAAGGVCGASESRAACNSRRQQRAADLCAAGFTPQCEGGSLERGAFPLYAALTGEGDASAREAGCAAGLRDLCVGPPPLWELVPRSDAGDPAAQTTLAGLLAGRFDTYTSLYDLPVARSCAEGDPSACTDLAIRTADGRMPGGPQAGEQKLEQMCTDGQIEVCDRLRGRDLARWRDLTLRVAVERCGPSRLDACDRAVAWQAPEAKPLVKRVAKETRRRCLAGEQAICASAANYSGYLLDERLERVAPRGGWADTVSSPPPCTDPSCAEPPPPSDSASALDARCRAGEPRACTLWPNQLRRELCEGGFERACYVWFRYVGRPTLSVALQMCERGDPTACLAAEQIDGDPDHKRRARTLADAACAAGDPNACVTAWAIGRDLGERFPPKRVWFEALCARGDVESCDYVERRTKQVFVEPWAAIDRHYAVGGGSSLAIKVEGRPE